MVFYQKDKLKYVHVNQFYKTIVIGWKSNIFIYPSTPLDFLPDKKTKITYL